MTNILKQLQSRIVDYLFPDVFSRLDIIFVGLFIALGYHVSIWLALLATIPLTLASSVSKHIVETRTARRAQGEE